MIPVKIICRCGQNYAFEVQPAHGRMPVPVFCPACGLEGTIEANQSIARVLHGKTQPLPPPSVNTVLTAVQTELARRPEAVQTPMLERLRAYEQRIQELEKDLSEQSKENRELLKMRIEIIRNQLETERERSRINFNWS